MIHYMQRTMIQMMADFLSETMDVRESRTTLFLTAKRRKKSQNSLFRKKYLQVCWQNKDVFQIK